jgi:rhodanese-related sulfurtransferase
MIGVNRSMMKKWIIWAWLLAALLLAACSGEANAPSAPLDPSEVTGREVQTAGGSYTDVTVRELEAMLTAKDFTFVNVHIPFEGDIPNTDLSIPYNQIDQHLDQLPADQDARIVLYCRSDRMSEIAARRLVELGYTNVYNLDGGFVAWEAAGLPVER